MRTEKPPVRVWIDGRPFDLLELWPTETLGFPESIDPQSAYFVAVDARGNLRLIYVAPCLWPGGDVFSWYVSSTDGRA
jgi:hypothetical protein